jgi:sulfite reductase alpha subunit-like flavoprotein
MGACLSGKRSTSKPSQEAPAENEAEGGTETAQPPTETKATGADATAAATDPAAASADNIQTKRAPTKVYVVYYSTYGHIETLARTMAKALAEAGTQVKVWRVRTS